MDPKNILLSIAGADGRHDYKDVQIQPGTRPVDILNQLNLAGFQLVNPQGGAFGFNEDLYPEVKDGCKVFAVKDDVTAGLVG